MTANRISHNCSVEEEYLFTKRILLCCYSRKVANKRTLVHGLMGKMYIACHRVTEYTYVQSISPITSSVRIIHFKCSEV